MKDPTTILTLALDLISPLPIVAALIRAELGILPGKDYAERLSTLKASDCVVLLVKNQPCAPIHLQFHPALVRTCSGTELSSRLALSVRVDLELVAAYRAYLGSCLVMGEVTLQTTVLCFSV